MLHNDLETRIVHFQVCMFFGFFGFFLWLILLLALRTILLFFLIAELLLWCP